MAHVGQELALGPVSGLGGRPGLFERLFEVLALGDVLDLRDEILGLPLGVAHQRGGDLAPDQMAVAMPITLLEDGVITLAPHRVRHISGAQRLVFGLGKVIDPPPLHLLPTATEEGGQPIVDLQDPALEVHQAHACIGVLEGQPETLLAVAQGRLLDALRGDVAADGDDPAGLALGVPLNDP